MNPPLIEATDLHVAYDEAPALHGIGLRLEAGEAIALMGRNGMGKTTLVRTLMGLVRTRRGVIRVNGQAMTGAAPHQFARAGLALVPEGRGIFPNLTVRENLLLAARPRNGGWTLDAVLELFPRLAGRLSRGGGEISGGEQQMVAIGRALLANPRLLLMDEATEGLAPAMRHEVWNVIHKIREFGVAALIVDKDPALLARVCERCLVLVKGRIAFEGPMARFAADNDLQARTLGL